MKLSHKEILPDDDVFLITRAMPSGKRPKLAHTHDFYELFWIVNGRVRHRINGDVEDLEEGDMVFIRPSDTHSVQGKGAEPHLINIALHPKLIAALAKRAPQLKGQFFWSDAVQPTVVHRDMSQLSELSQALRAIDPAPRDPLSAEALLLPLLVQLSAHRTTVAMPDWLAAACQAAHAPAVFQDGAAGFVRSAGRTHAHVSRETRKHLGVSPSELINDIRMDYAARQLSASTDTLAEIAADCGIPNLSHFHRLFRDAYKLTPNAYRKRHQRDVIQPA
ncbi:AraC family transcriptional regulator [Cognatishimia sp. MH4019]|uniref:AraC family transcriptional regulator n=1 Tax=Cognatishimia sp. MH4019 TaxID=2854030 RepID=UPI001CD37A0C|nr:helix-turn-helix domain-containing protein [Cognatishimia sp. MH4019]